MLLKRNIGEPGGKTSRESTSCKGRDEQIQDNTAMCYRKGTEENLVEKPLMIRAIHGVVRPVMGGFFALHL